MSRFLLFSILLVTSLHISWAGVKSPARDYSQTDSLIAQISTHEGMIEINLLFKEAPITVANFEKLSQSGFYNGLVFHRVIQGFMIQTGCPHGNGTGDAGYSIPFERNQLKHEIGMVSMANKGGLDTGGSQFFMVQYPQPQLNGKHTIFGQIINGLDVIYRVEKGDPMIKVEIREVFKQKSSSNPSKAKLSKTQFPKSKLINSKVGS